MGIVDDTGDTRNDGAFYVDRVRGLWEADQISDFGIFRHDLVASILALFNGTMAAAGDWSYESPGYRSWIGWLDTLGVLFLQPGRSVGSVAEPGWNPCYLLIDKGR